jgi:hypothetical protein
MLRNLPNNLKRSGLLELFDALGFQGLYDFVYLPIDFSRMANVGYCYLNPSAKALHIQKYLLRVNAIATMALVDRRRGRAPRMSLINLYICRLQKCTRQRYRQ